MPLPTTPVIPTLASGSLSAGQISLVNYVSAWGQMSLPLAETDPFAIGQLPGSVEAAIKSGAVHVSSLPLQAANAYVVRTRGYEGVLLESLGFAEGDVVRFARQREPFGDHFQKTAYPWNEYARASAVVVAEMTGLHDSLSRALSVVQEWKRSFEFFPDGGDYVDVREFLAEPLADLQSLLIERIGHARNVVETYDVNMEAGLLAYFHKYRRRHSGVVPILVQAGISFADSTPPPKVANE